MRSLLSITLLLLSFLSAVSNRSFAQSANPATAPHHEDFKSILNRVKKLRYSNPDSAGYYAKIGLELATVERDSSAIADMLNQQGMIEDNNGRYLMSGKKYMRALALYRGVHNRKGEASTLIRLGVVELRKGNYDRASARFLDALRVSESANDLAGIMEANITMAEVFIKQEEYQDALRYLKIAEGLDKKLPFSSLRLNMYNNFGIVYRELNLYDLAEDNLEEGIRQSLIPGMEGLNITLSNTLAGVYTRRGMHKNAIRILRGSLTKSRKIHNYIREVQTLLELSDLYRKSRPDSAVSYLQQALKLAEDKKSYKQQIDILNKLAIHFEKAGDFRQAYNMKDSSQLLADSFYYQDMSREIANLQAEYELGKSKAALQQLQFKNKQQKFERNIILGLGAGMVVIIVIISYNFFRTSRLNDLLNKSNNDLSASNEVKDKLFSIIAHDLRMPLTSAISVLPLINDEDVSEKEKQEIIDALINNFNNSLDTLNQLLRWGEMQIKGVAILPEEFDAAIESSNVIRFLEPQALSKNIILSLEVPHGSFVFADKNHFNFILRNLVSNAIKFSPAGERIRVVTQFTDGKQRRFQVCDKGVGIAPDRLSTMFTVKNTSTRGTNNEKGTSLGLLMCKEFVEKNAGSISVESKLNEGSVFTFTLPAGQFDKSLKDT